MHNPVFEYPDTLSFALLACIILYINGKQFRCSVFTFVKYSIDIKIDLPFRVYILDEKKSWFWSTNKYYFQ